MKTAYLDFETYSDADIKKLGGIGYAMHPSTEILIVSFSYDGNHYQVNMHDSESRKKELLSILDAATKMDRIVAHNAQFERAIWENVGVKKYGFPSLPGNIWDCTAIRAAMCGLPRSLEKACEELNGPQKDHRGSGLIKVFCCPQKDGSRIYPHDRPEQFDDFMEYGLTDNECCIWLDENLPTLPDGQRVVMEMDYTINETGIPIDVEMLNRANKFVASNAARIHKKCLDSIGLKPSQTAKILEWLQSNGVKVESLGKAILEDILENEEISEIAREVILSRLESSKSGTKKLASMAKGVLPGDNVVRGVYMMYGAGTGRWTSKGIQFHNLARGNKRDYAFIVKAFNRGDYERYLNILGVNTLAAISNAVRAFIKPSSDKKLVVSDYNAIEARVLAWLAKDQFMLRAFHSGECPYRKMAGVIYSKPADSVTDDERFVGKQAVLGCGYGMGWKRFQEQAQSYGVELPDEICQNAVSVYRKSVVGITRLWGDVEKAAIICIRTNLPQITHGLSFYMLAINGVKFMRMELPSGRSIYYPHIGIIDVDGIEQIHYKGIYNKKMISKYTYGAKIVENAVQGISFDITCNGVYNAMLSGYTVIGHSHDEIITEALINNLEKLETLGDVICRLPDWAKGLPVKASTTVSERYQK